MQECISSVGFQQTESYSEGGEDGEDGREGNYAGLIDEQHLADL